MVEENTKLIKIDLNQFKLHLYLKSDVELTLHFDSPSRRFYLSVIAFVIQEMKRHKRIVPIPLQNYIDILALLNETVGGAAGSSKKEYLLPRIYRKWKDALPDLENAPLFKVIGKKKKFDELMDKVYSFSEGEKDNWANLFEFKGSHEHVKLRFSIDRLDLTLDDVIIIYGEHPEQDTVNAWEGFIEHLKNNVEEKSIAEHLNREPKISELLFVRHKLWSNAMPKNSRWLMLCVLVTIAVAAVCIVVWNTYFFTPQIEFASIEKMIFSLPEEPSIAVLPFHNLSDDPKQNYFCDGLTEEIINGLSKISSIFVISPNSMFTYKGKTVEIKQVSEDLGVRFVIEGSVRKDEDRIRITARLIDALAGHNLWSERYEREMEDIFSIQDEITMKILTALQIQLIPGDRFRLLEKQTDNLKAYLKIFEGNNYLREYNFNDSIRCFEEARALDPRFSEAYAWESLAHMYNFWFGSSSTRIEPLIKATVAANKCMEINCDLATCNMAKGLVHLMNREYLDAITNGRRAVELRPNSDDAATCLAIILQVSGLYKEALMELERSLRLNPIRPEYALSILGLTYFNMGRYEEAITACKKVIERSSFKLDQLQANMVLALAYGSLGRSDEARLAVNSILNIRPDISPEDFLLIVPKKTEKDINSILNGLL